MPREPFTVDDGSPWQIEQPPAAGFAAPTCTALGVAKVSSAQPNANFTARAGSDFAEIVGGLAASFEWEFEQVDLDPFGDRTWLWPVGRTITAEERLIIGMPGGCSVPFAYLGEISVTGPVMAVPTISSLVALAIWNSPDAVLEASAHFRRLVFTAGVLVRAFESPLRYDEVTFEDLPPLPAPSVGTLWELAKSEAVPAELDVRNGRIEDTGFGAPLDQSLWELISGAAFLGFTGAPAVFANDFLVELRLDVDQDIRGSGLGWWLNFGRVFLTSATITGRPIAHLPFGGSLFVPGTVL